MTIRNAMLLSAALAAVTALGAGAQPQYAQHAPAPVPMAVAPAPAIPPSWSYDPYTSGLGPCPQRYPTEPPCSWTISPTYGQPNYWSSR